MQALGVWFTTQLGLSGWLVGLILLPLLSVLLIFSLREIVLKIYFHLGSVTDRQGVWRRITRYAAVIASLMVVGMSWSAYGSVIASIASAASSRSPGIIAGLLAFLLYATVLGLLMYWVQQAYRVLTARIESRFDKWEGLQMQDAVFLPGDSVPHLAALSLRILRGAGMVFLLYLFVPLFLGVFPATRPMAHELMLLVLDPLGRLVRAIIGYIPHLIVLVLIITIARWTLNFLRALMQGVAAGQIKLGNFDPDWAEQTYRLLSILVVFAAVLIMYPYLPGSSSAVFKGFSVFVGAMVTFGATTTTNNFVSGLVLTYTHSFRVGDYVKIGDQVGDVIEIGMVVTKLRTLDNEKVTIANTEVLKEEIVNYTDASELGGLRLRVPIGIGYDTEWRDVYRLLVKAARSTDNIKHDPAPFVQQDSLDDFAVTYVLAVYVDDPVQKPKTLTELRQNIQDVFNGAGIEIMTPSVRAVRDSLDPAMPEKYLSEAPAVTDAPGAQPGDAG
jgi:small-conductance mechanosensitive channel